MAYQSGKSLITAAWRLFFFFFFCFPQMEGRRLRWGRAFSRRLGRFGEDQDLPREVEDDDEGS